MIHPFLLLENINKDKTGISHPFTIVIISPAPFIALSSPFHNPFITLFQYTGKSAKRTI